MAFEKRWELVPVKSLLVDGGTDGLITVPNAIDFRVKQDVLLKATGLDSKVLEVKSIISQTQLYVGRKGKIDLREDVSAYTVALSSTLQAEEQPRNAIPDKEYERASFEEEPVVAKRVIQVDRLGNKYDAENPIPTTNVPLNNQGRMTKIEINDTTWTLLERSGATSPTGLGPLPNRKLILIQNLSGKDVIIQYDSGTVDDTISIVIPDGVEKLYEFGPDIKLYAKSGKPLADIVIEEVS